MSICWVIMNDVINERDYQWPERIVPYTLFDICFPPTFKTDFFPQNYQQNDTYTFKNEPIKRVHYLFLTK